MPTFPIFGEALNFDPSYSYDLDGTVIAWQWKFENLTTGEVTISNTKLPGFPTTGYKYKATLTVTDNEGLVSDPFTQVINVRPKLVPLVYHTPYWDQVRIKNSRPFNMFYAREKFLIRLTTTPAERVEGKVNFGGKVGVIDMPSGAFTKVDSSGTVWKTEMWIENFKTIPDGEYVFEFTSYHNAGSETVTADAVYNIIIKDNVYDATNFHRSR